MRLGRLKYKEEDNLITLFYLEDTYIHIYICMYLQFHDLQVDIRFSFLRNKFAEFRFACLVSANFTNLSRSLYAKAVFHSVF